MDLGRVGIWTFALDQQPVAAAQEAVAELEELGYGAVWLPEAVGRDPLVHAALLLSASQRIVLASGVASIYGRDPMTANAGQLTLEEAFPGRFVLGLGVSHQPLVEGMRGHTYGRPLAAMAAFLDGMDRAMFAAAPPATEPRRVLAALGPRMLELAAARADGAHTYFVPVEHTTLARQRLGSGRLLCVEQAVVLETDPEVAREQARRYMSGYLALPNYTNNLRRLGWDDADLADGGSDRLVDAIVAWGTEDDIAARVQAHREAGADHVCIQVLPRELPALPKQEWRRLSEVLIDQNRQ